MLLALFAPGHQEMEENPWIWETCSATLQRGQDLIPGLKIPLSTGGGIGSIQQNSGIGSVQQNFGILFIQQNSGIGSIQQNSGIWFIQQNSGIGFIQ